jgi:hypothetical protein
LKCFIAERRTNCGLNVGAISGYSSQVVLYSRPLKFKASRAEFVRFDETGGRSTFPRVVRPAPAVGFAGGKVIEDYW